MTGSKAVELDKKAVIRFASYIALQLSSMQMCSFQVTTRLHENCVNECFVSSTTKTRNSAIADKPRGALIEVSQSHQTCYIPFHMLGIDCPIATLSVRRTIFEIFDFKNAVT